MGDDVVRDEADLLREFLATRDVVCPHCRYSLLGLTNERCPECGFELKLVLAPSAKPRPVTNRVFEVTFRVLKFFAVMGGVAIFVNAMVLILGTKGHTVRMTLPPLHPVLIGMLGIAPGFIYVLWGRAREGIVASGWVRANWLSVAAVLCAMACFWAVNPFFHQ